MSLTEIAAAVGALLPSLAAVGAFGCQVRKERRAERAGTPTQTLEEVVEHADADAVLLRALDEAQDDLALEREYVDRLEARLKLADLPAPPRPVSLRRRS